MKSIRLSLIWFFLLLQLLALGLTLAFVYQTTAQTLAEKDRNAVRFLDAENENRCEALKHDFDNEILRQAQDLAKEAQSQWGLLNVDAVYAASFQASGFAPGGPVLNGLWTVPGSAGHLAARMARRPFLKINFDNEANAGPVANAPRDFYVFYNEDGAAVQKSRSLGRNEFDRAPIDRRQMPLYSHEFDDSVLSDGLGVRRVTLKMPVASVRRPSMRLMMDGRDSPGSSAIPLDRHFWTVPSFFIQYARDKSERDKALQAYAKEFQFSIAQQKHESASTLASLRGWVLGIGLVAFAISVAGAYWLVNLGLMPLQRLSDAVSKVCAKDFRLAFDAAELPQELQPICQRLETTFAALERAFAREKQAAADISHELRTPLAALLANLDVSLRRQRTPEQYAELLRECRALGGQLAQLVERMLALARIDAGADTLRPQAVDVAALASQCVAMVRPLAEARDVTLQIRSEGPATIETDANKLREVITNLLHNAVEYNKPRGRIDVSVERQNGHLEVRVRDTGIGISPKQMGMIFERFFRADESRQADSLHAGLGLAIVKGYLEILGGRINVQSTEGEGSTFRVVLPMRTPSPAST